MKSCQRPTPITPIAFAVTALVSATLLVAAQRTHAAEADGNGTQLLPTKDPCGSCDRPIAQAPTGAVAPQSLPAPPRNTGAPPARPSSSTTCASTA